MATHLRIQVAHVHRRLLVAIRGLLPQPQAHQLPLMGVDPKYQNRGYGRVLLRAVERLCEDNPRGSGLVLDTGNSRYLPFYESEGFRSLGKIRMCDFEDHVLFRQLSEARPAASAAPS